MSAASIGIKIKEHLDQNGIKYSFVAEKANIPAPVMSVILSGSRDVKILEYYRICKVLNVPFEKFISGSEEE
jgi:transcriptional regulator with XRE-family HTH domain